jgi:hypothetical protein
LCDESLGAPSALTEEVKILTDPNTDIACNLQNVVSFPVAFTNAALHQVELLKLMHLIREVSFNVWFSLRSIAFCILIYIIFFFRLATNPWLGGH